MNDLAPHWVALISALCGALIGSFSGLLGGFLAFRRERWLRRRDEKLKKYEEIYERLDAMHAMHSSAVTPACFAFLQGRLPNVAKEIKHEDSSKLDMLIGLYAPELSERYQKVRETYTKLLGVLMDTSIEMANQRSPKAGVEAMMSGIHDGASEIGELKKEISRLARRHAL